MPDAAAPDGRGHASVTVMPGFTRLLIWSGHSLSDAAGTLLAEDVDASMLAGELARRFELDAVEADDIARSSPGRGLITLADRRQLFVASTAEGDSASSSGGAPGRVFVLIEERSRAPADVDARIILDAMPTPALLWSWEDPPRVLRSNEPFRRMTGLQPDGLASMSLLDLQRRMKVEFEAPRPSRIGMGRAHGTQLWTRDPSGQRRLHVIQVLPLRSLGDRVALAIYLDITHTVQAERALKARELARLAASVSHDINNALTILSGILGVLVDSDRTARLELAEDVGDTIDGMKALLARLQRLSIGQDLALTQDAAPTAFDVHECIERVCRMVSLRYPDLELETALPAGDADGGPWLLMPAVELERALTNLLANAVEAGGERSHVRVTLRAYSEGPGCEIDVEDDGPGFPPELLETAFEPHVTTGGYGLGLFQVRSLTRQLGGDAEAGRSEGLGGARVTIRFGSPP